MKLPLKQYLKLLAHYLRPQRTRALLMGALLLVSIGLQLANPQVLRYFIDTATGGGNPSLLLLAAALFIGIAIINQGVSIYSRYLSENVAWTATNAMRADLLAHCLSLDMAFHKEHTPGELIERIDGDVNILSNFFSAFVVYLLGNAILLVGILLLLLQIDWRVGLALAIFVLLALFILISIRGRIIPLWTADRQMDAEFYGFLGEQLAGTEDIRANGATGYIMRRFHLFLNRWYPIHRKAAMGYFAMGMTTLTLFAIGNALAFALGAYLWSIGKISLGIVYIIFYYTNLLTQQENILLGLPEARVDLQAAVEMAVMEKDIAELEQGLATMIGTRGVKLSGGQAQRAAAARMFVREPELLVCDDLSSALDVETERTLWERLFARRANASTCLVVSHRRPVLQRADHIIVLKDGRVESEGTLHELLQTCEEMQRLAQRGICP